MDNSYPILKQVRQTLYDVLLKWNNETQLEFEQSIDKESLKQMKYEYNMPHRPTDSLFNWYQGTIIYPTFLDFSLLTPQMLKDVVDFRNLRPQFTTYTLQAVLNHKCGWMLIAYHFFKQIFLPSTAPVFGTDNSSFVDITASKQIKYIEIFQQPDYMRFGELAHILLSYEFDEQGNIAVVDEDIYNDRYNFPVTISSHIPRLDLDLLMLVIGFGPTHTDVETIKDICVQYYFTRPSYNLALSSIIARNDALSNKPPNEMFSIIFGQYVWPKNWMQLQTMHTRMKNAFNFNRLGLQEATAFHMYTLDPYIRTLFFIPDGFNIYIPRIKFLFMATRYNPLLKQIYRYNLNWNELMTAHFWEGMPDEHFNVDVFLDNFVYYAPIYVVSDKIPLEEITLEKSAYALCYSDTKLIEYYNAGSFGPTEFFSRLQWVVSMVRQGTVDGWLYLSTDCANPDPNNVLTLEPRVDAEDDIIHSWGTTRKYLCYNESELMASFREDAEYGWVFSFPDNPKMMFSTQSIKQLRDHGVTAELEEKINRGLELLEGNEHKLDKWRIQYRELSHSGQDIIDNFVIWMFILGQVLRFWKGPGYSWIYEWKESDQRTTELFCTQDVHDKRVVDMLASFFHEYETYPKEVRSLIKKFVVMQYSDATRAFALSSMKIISLLEKIFQSNFCLANASDILLQTSLFLAFELIGWSLDDLNMRLNKYIFPDGTGVQLRFEPAELVGKTTHHIDVIFEFLEKDRDKVEQVENKIRQKYIFEHLITGLAVPEPSLTEMIANEVRNEMFRLQFEEEQ